MTAWSIDDVKANAEARDAVVDLLFQLADDDFILGFRDQEWLGLAPHIEEDVAFGSIGQEEIGHAALYYGILEALGAGRPDDLASLREAHVRRNSVLVEQPNGSGDYLNAPVFDWAWTIVRHYLHDVWEMTRLEALTTSAFLPLREAAPKILAEKRYHRAHQELWLTKMAHHSASSRERLELALAKAATWAGDLPDFGAHAETLERLGIVPELNAAAGRFQQQVADFFDGLGLRIPPWGGSANGRLGQHTDELETALATLSEVYRLDPAAQW